MPPLSARAAYFTRVERMLDGASEQIIKEDHKITQQSNVHFAMSAIAVVGNDGKLAAMYLPALYEPLPRF